VATTKSSTRLASPTKGRTPAAQLKTRPSSPTTATAGRAHKTPARRADAQGAPQATPNNAGRLTTEEIRVLVSDAAYLRAAARDFEPGHDLEDWFAAEAEIHERLARGC
jgi:hypothetical protein